MKPGAGRDKGCDFEREMAWHASQWWFGTPRVLRRTPGSGGWSKTSCAGDLISEMPSFPFQVECKFTVSWSFTDFFLPTWGSIGDFWDQCLGDCSKKTAEEVTPILVFRTNNSPSYCMFHTVDLNMPLIQGRMMTVDRFGCVCCVMRFEKDLLLIHPNHIARLLVRNKQPELRTPVLLDACHAKFPMKGADATYAAHTNVLAYGTKDEYLR